MANMSKQDRQGARTPADLERKYNFGKTFAEVMGIATDAQQAADKAASGVDGLDKKLDQTEIFNRLTNNGTSQGIYRGDDGEIYINASYIVSGELVADIIKSGAIKSIDGTSVVIDLEKGTATLTGTFRSEVLLDNGDIRHSTIGSGICTMASGDYRATYWAGGFNIFGPGVSMYAEVQDLRSSIGGLTEPVYDEDATNKVYVDGLAKSQNVLWSGGNYMLSTQTANLSQKISQQPKGVYLVWSAYANGAAADSDFHFTFVPRHFVKNHAGRGVSSGLMTNAGGHTVGTKYVYVHDDKIVGAPGNSENATRANGITVNNAFWVLRYVIGV